MRQNTLKASNLVKNGASVAAEQQKAKSPKRPTVKQQESDTKILSSASNQL